MGSILIHQFLTKLRNPKDIYASLRPLLFCCMVGGIAPFKLVGTPGNRYLVVTTFGIALTVFHLVWFCSCFIRLFNDHDLESYLFVSKVARLGEDIELITSFVIIVFLLILCFLKHNKLRKLLNSVVQIDGKFTNLGVKINYNYTSKILWGTVMLQSAILLILIGSNSIIMGAFKDFSCFLQWLFSNATIAIIVTFKSKYFCVMQLIKSRFNYIHTILNRLRTHAEADEKRLNGILLCGIVSGKEESNFEEITFNVKNFGVDSKRKRHDIVAELCRIHEVLCDACILVEEYFCHQMLILVIIEFVSTVLYSYFMFDVTFGKTPTPEISPINMFVYYIINTTIMIGTLFGLLRATETVTIEVSLVPETEVLFFNDYLLIYYLRPE